MQKQNKRKTFAKRNVHPNMIHNEIKVLEVQWFTSPPPPPSVLFARFLRLFMIISLNSSEIKKCFRQTL
jgi:hypothetical protein